MAVTCVVTDHEAGLQVALSGSLTMSDVGSLRLRLFKCLAEQPHALFVELSELTVAEPLALTVLAAVSRQAARWPGIPVLLCAPAALVGAMLARPAYRRLPVFPTIERAAAQVDDYRHSLPSISDQLLPIAGAVREARGLATEACLRWELPGLVGPASLIVDEMVSNVADHANTMATLRLTLRPNFLMMAVEDGSSEPPVPSDDPRAVRGRGLLLIQAMAHSWGWLPTEGGKVVWATLAVTA
ncbi:ATP-binding protein [Actinoplanes sp. NPDC051470]|uniref:ATP-binding protein n=1 Tax=unclassified Actinoplanes TaxID=2626549 RepID=UPI003429378C